MLEVDVKANPDEEDVKDKGKGKGKHKRKSRMHAAAIQVAAGQAAVAGNAPPMAAASSDGPLSSSSSSSSRESFLGSADESVSSSSNASAPSTSSAPVTLPTYAHPHAIVVTPAVTAPNEAVADSRRAQLLANIRKITVGKDTHSNTVALLHEAHHHLTQSHPLLPPLAQMPALLSTLLPACRLIDWATVVIAQAAGVRLAPEDLLARQQALLIQTLTAQHPALAPLSALQTQLAATLTAWSAHPEMAHCAQLLQTVAAGYAAYLSCLCEGDAATRRDLLAPKARLYLVGDGYYQLEMAVARQLLCQDAYGKLIKSNETGNNAVASLGGVHYKPNKGINVLQPNKEHAVCALHETLSAGLETVAATALVNVDNVLTWHVPRPAESAGQSQTAYRAYVSEVHVRQQPLATALAKAPAWASALVIERQWQGCLVQAGLTIEGLCFESVLALQADVALLSRRLPNDAADIITQVLNEDGFYQPGLDALQALSSTEANSSALAPSLKNPGLATLEAAFVQLNARYPRSERLLECADDGHCQDIALIHGAVGTRRLVEVLGLLYTHPSLMAGQSFSQLARLPMRFRRLLPQLIAPVTAKAALAQLPRLLEATLDEDATSALFVSALLYHATDAKADNFMLRVERDAGGRVRRSWLVGIDNDRGLAFPLQRHPVDGHYVRIKNLLYCLPAVRGQVLSPRVRAALLAQAPSTHLMAWLGQVLVRDEGCQRALRQGAITPADIERSAREHCDIPLTLSASVVRYTYAKLQQLQALLRDEASLRHEDLLAALYPVVDCVYRRVMAQVTDPLSAQWTIYKGWVAHETLETQFAKVWDSERVAGQLLSEHLAALHPVLQAHERDRVSLATLAQTMLTHFAWQDRTLPEQVQFLSHVVVHTDIKQLALLAGHSKQLLLTAVSRLASPALVRLLLASGGHTVYLDEATPTGQSLLDVLCRNYINDVPAALALLPVLIAQDGSSLYRLNSRGYAPLVQALQVTSDAQAEVARPFIEALIAAGADIDLATSSGHGVLDKLASWGRVRLWALCVELGARQVAAPAALLHTLRQDAWRSTEVDEALVLLQREQVGLQWVAGQRQWCLPVNAPAQRQRRRATMQLALGNRTALPAAWAPQLAVEGDNQRFRAREGCMGYGRREVKGLRHAGVSLHVKKHPELAGVQYAVQVLARWIAPTGIAPGALALIESEEGTPYPAWVSHTVVGENLYDVLKSGEEAAFLPYLAPARLSALMCLAMIINAEDGKPDNYVLRRLPGEAVRYELVGVDEDHAFVVGVTRHMLAPETLHVKSVLFCLDAMCQPLHPQVRARLLSLSVDEVLGTWLEALATYYKGVQKLLASGEQARLWAGSGSMLGRLFGRTGVAPQLLTMPFYPGTIARLYAKLRRLQRALRQNAQLTHLGLLRVLEPQVASYYAAALAKPTVRERFRAISDTRLRLTARGHETLTTTQDAVHLQALAASSSPAASATPSVTWQDVVRHCSPSAAQAELVAVQREWHEEQHLIQAVQSGDVQPFAATYQREDMVTHLLRQIDFSQWPLEQQAQLLDAAIAAPSRQVRRLFLRGCQVLTAERLRRLLAGAAVITRIHLQDCVVDDAMVGIIARRGQHLLSLHITGSSALTRVQNGRQAAAFPQLKRLMLADNSNLKGIAVEAPRLTTLITADCGHLQHLTVATRCLTHLNVAHNGQLQSAVLSTLLAVNPGLVHLEMPGLGVLEELALPQPLSLATLVMDGIRVSEVDMATWFVPGIVASLHEAIDKKDFEAMARACYALGGCAAAVTSCVAGEPALIWLCRRGINSAQAAKQWAVWRALVRFLLANGVDVDTADNEGMTALLWVCRDGFELAETAPVAREVVFALLAHGANVDAVDNEGITALIWVCYGVFENAWTASASVAREVVLALLAHGANVDAVNNNRMTALMCVCYEGFKQAVRMPFAREVVLALLERGADVNAADDYGKTALMLMCYEGFKQAETAPVAREVVFALLAHGAKVNAADDYGKTALMLMCYEGFKQAETAPVAREVVLALLERGADVNAASNNGMTALLSVCRDGFKQAETAPVAREVVLTLLERGAKVDAVKKWSGETALQFVCREGFKRAETAPMTREMVFALLAHGANVDAVSKWDGKTALLWVCRYGFKQAETAPEAREVVLALLAHGANVNAADKWGKTALLWVCRYGFKQAETAPVAREVVFALLAHGAKVDAAGNNGMTALLWVCRHGFERTETAPVAREVVLTLLEHGAKVDVLSGAGVTALPSLCCEGFQRAETVPIAREVVLTLLKHGAKADDGGEAALLSLCCEDFKRAETASIAREVVLTLLKHRAKAATADGMGRTALWYLSRDGFKQAETAPMAREVVLALLERGADVNAADDYGKTALMLMCYEGFKQAETAPVAREVVLALLERGANVDAAGNNGMTALMLMYYEGFQQAETAPVAREVVLALLERGADVNAASNNGMTALLWVCFGVLKSAVTASIARKAVMTLIDLGANVNAVGKFDMTALLWVCCQGFKRAETAPMTRDVVLALLERGAKVNVVDKWGSMTALLYVCREGFKQAETAPMARDVVLTLLEHGADVNAASNNGMTALLWVCRHGFEHAETVPVARDVVLTLLNYGATNVDEAVQMAKWTGNQALMQLIRDWKAGKIDRTIKAVSRSKAPITAAAQLGASISSILRLTSDAPAAKAADVFTQFTQRLAEIAKALKNADKDAAQKLFATLQQSLAATSELKHALHEVQHAAVLQQYQQLVSELEGVDMSCEAASSSSTSSSGPAFSLTGAG